MFFKRKTSLSPISFPFSLGRSSILLPSSFPLPLFPLCFPYPSSLPFFPTWFSSRTAWFYSPPPGRERKLYTPLALQLRPRSCFPVHKGPVWVNSLKSFLINKSYLRFIILLKWRKESTKRLWCTSDSEVWKGLEPSRVIARLTLKSRVRLHSEFVSESHDLWKLYQSWILR